MTMTMTRSTRVLRIIDRSGSGFCLNPCCLILFVVSLCVFVSRVGRDMNWSHATGIVVSTVETIKQTKNGHYILYQPMISFQPQEKDNESIISSTDDDNDDDATVVVVTFISRYGSRSKYNTKYPIGSTMTVLYDPRNYERAEMIDENKKGIQVSGSLAGSIAVVSSAMIYFVYRQARAEIAMEEQLYPPGYELHDDDKKSGADDDAFNTSSGGGGGDTSYNNMATTRQVV